MNLNDADRAESELRHALAGGNQGSIATAVLDNVWPLYSSHHELLLSTIVALPSPLLERHPILRLLHPLTPVLARTARPFKPLVSADQARLFGPDELDLLALAQMIAFRSSGDLESSLVYARRLEDRIVQTRVESRERTDGPLWYYHHEIGSTLLAAGDSVRALVEFATARQLGRFALQRDAERLALGRMALAHAMRGSLDDAVNALAEAAKQPPATPAHRSAARATESAASALVGAERLADDLDERLAALEPYDSVELTWPFALLARSRSLLARHRPDEALEAIRLAAAAHPTQSGSFADDVVAAASIEALIALGEFAAARSLAGSDGSGVLTSLARVRLGLHEGDVDGAARLLRTLGADRTLGPAAHAEWLVLSAWHEFATTGGLLRDTAVRVLRVGTRRDSRRLFASAPRQLVELVRQHLPQDIPRGFDGMVGDLERIDIKARPQLTVGELRILRALPAHDTTAAIAASFHVSPNTVKSQLQSMYRKLGCSTRDEALRLAAGYRLFSEAPGSPRTPSVPVTALHATSGTVRRPVAVARTVEAAGPREADR
ncbi:hypothetical protein LLS1_13550 [Leifsonia sp. LS1]|uniref:LuxR C-terminal-related transcriptional regulator n=1 Tax=Leifsonia sp. LS1 TaxID=2828483 RepID=UPI001CFEEF2B|nr:LuxR family transcriptional regulator [Leifsonia sp. LS1]GIT79686.1 hypothetical protein LLS1_13550 [Leifsonia sp. LS1]